MNQKKKGYLMVASGAIMWGTLPIFTNVGFRLGSDGMTSGAMRAYLAALIYIVWSLADGSFKKLKKSELPFYFLYGIVAGGGTFVFYMIALEHLSVAMSAMLLYTAPAFVILFDRLIYKVPLGKFKLIAVICSFAGSFLVVRGYDFSSLQASFKGILFGLASGFCYSMTSVMGKKAKALHGGRFNSTMMVIFGTLAFLILKPPYTISMPSVKVLLIWIALAVIGTVLPYMFYLKGLSCNIDIGAASIVATVEPIVGTVLGVLVLGQTLELPQVIGILMMLSGIAISVHN